MRTQPMESLRSISDHHLMNMDSVHKRALLYRADGENDIEAALLETVSVSTIKSRLGVASSEIAMCLPHGKKLTGELRGAWVQAHVACC